MKLERTLALAAATAAAIALAGCWGGDDPAAPETATRVPDGAAASSAAFVGYLRSLNANDETSEPATIGATFAVPADDTSEPAPIGG